MKRVLLVLLVGVLCMPATGQQRDTAYLQPPTLGVQFFFHDFETPQQIRASSLSATLRDGHFARLREMVPGLAITYLDGLNKHFDFSSTITGSFVDYPKKDQPAFGADYFLLEGDVSLRGKMFTNKSWFTPYMQLGAGAFMYKGYWGSFIPAGVGLQFNFYDEAFFLINAQYRIPVSSTAADHFFFSIGLAGVIDHDPETRKPQPLLLPQLPAAARDSDGDGIVDSLDACPSVAGIARFNGCPDSDGDGIPDSADKCPHVKGTARYNGCPVPDSDGDGVNDELDKCPDQVGVARYNGCPVPDSDGDGVDDEHDACPFVAGSATRHGCPEVAEATQIKIATAARHILFETGSYRLAKTSFKALDEIVTVLQQDTVLQLTIAGHTDAEGDDQANQLLSEQRAQAVLEYLQQKGINPDRMRSEGYGETKPIADNTTPAGRAQNRRVEITLRYDK